MTRDEMLLDTVGRLDEAVKKLETIVGGDPDLGYRGLSQRVERLEADVKRITSQRSSIVQWTIGYTLLGSFVAVLATGNPIDMMLIVTIIGLFILAGVFLASGLGMLKWP